MLGDDPVSGLAVTLRPGRFGPYVQLGEAAEGEKPKRAGLPRGTEAGAVDLDMALKLLALPREIGRHPEDGEPILAGIGRFGPYVQHGKVFANLEPGDDVLNVGLNRAVALIADKIAKGPKARRFGDPGRSLGEHPQKGGPVLAKAGRYGPYVSHDGINATLPKDKTAETITLDEALGLLAARAERVGETGPRRGKRQPRPPKGCEGSAKPKSGAANGPDDAATSKAATATKMPRPAKSDGKAARAAPAPKSAKTSAKPARRCSRQQTGDRRVGFTVIGRGPQIGRDGCRKVEAGESRNRARQDRPKLPNRASEECRPRSGCSHSGPSCAA